MAFIETIPVREARGELRELFEKGRDPETGDVDNILQVHALHPAGLAAHLSLYTSAMTGTRSLPKVDRELIAFVTSRLNDCHY